MYTVIQQKFTHVQEHEFIRGRFLGVGKADACFGWLVSVFFCFLISYLNSKDMFVMYMQKFLFCVCVCVYSRPLQQSFIKQFLASVNRSDYITMRLGFVRVCIYIYISDFDSSLELSFYLQ